MSYNRERDEFIARMSREGMPIDTIRGLLRYSTTLQRLAEASCNGDWPADNGERKTAECPQCGGHWAPSSFKAVPPTIKVKVCPDCYAEAKVKALTPGAWQPVFNGDPRGAVLKLARSHATREDIDSGRESTIYVPAGGR